MTTNFSKTLKGYTTQARWYAANMATTNAEGDWAQAGWTKLGNGAVKPVFRLANGLPVVILDGRNHLTVVVNQVPAGCVFETEDQARAQAAGW